MEDKIFNIAIVGAGPSGVSAAVEAICEGIDDVVLFEKTDAHFGMMRQYYKDGKRVDKEYKGCDGTLLGHIDFKDGNKESTIEFFENEMKKHNVNIQYNTNIEKISKGEDGIFSIYRGTSVYKARYILISIGTMGKPNKPSYKIPSSLKKIINFNANECGENENILVVGGGNSGLEYALDLKKNNKITINSREANFDFANDQNKGDVLDANKAGEIELILAIDIVSLEDVDGKIKANFADNNSYIYDRVVYAIGGSTPVDFLKGCGIEIGEKNKPEVGESCESNVKDIFIAGDLIADKIGSIVTGLNHSFNVVQAIKQRINSK